MTLDAYETTHFYWIDAGISRFFQVICSFDL